MFPTQIMEITKIQNEKLVSAINGTIAGWIDIQQRNF